MVLEPGDRKGGTRNREEDMTPEARAEQLLHQLTAALMGRSLLTDIAMPLIIQAIKDAVEEEKEACAKVVDEFVPSSYIETLEDFREDLVRAIRSRNAGAK